MGANRHHTILGDTDIWPIQNKRSVIQELAVSSIHIGVSYTV